MVWYGMVWYGMVYNKVEVSDCLSSADDSPSDRTETAVDAVADPAVRHHYSSRNSVLNHRPRVCLLTGETHDERAWLPEADAREAVRLWNVLIQSLREFKRGFVMAPVAGLSACGNVLTQCLSVAEFKRGLYL